MSAILLPPDVESLLGQLHAAENEVLALASGLTPAQFDWRPDGGRRWSVGHCVEHLAVANRVYVEALAPGLSEARTRGRTRRGPMKPSLLERAFIFTIEPPPRFPAPAPKKILPPDPKTIDETVGAFRSSQEAVRTLLRANADVDLNAARFVNPFVAAWKPSCAMGFLVIAAHERRHLLQARNVTRNAAFPG